MKDGKDFPRAENNATVAPKDRSPFHPVNPNIEVSRTVSRVFAQGILRIRHT